MKKTFVPMSALYAPTLREDPAEADIASHRLMLRAGYIRRVASGVYSFLPLAQRVIRKVETIIREEMDAIGAQEMLLPIMTPGELWHESGRWDKYGAELMRIQDRHEREFCLGPTHEETITDLVRHELRSYKQLPVTLYQIQIKFRDELRPRFGLMRSREFVMKDAYSFSATQESLEAIYEDMGRAYQTIFDRCGLNTVAVTADSGEIGGTATKEYMALADTGEAEIVWSPSGYAADTEAATVRIPVAEGPQHETLTKVATPGCATIAQVAAFFGIEEKATRKSLALFDATGQAHLVLVPGDHGVNDVKLAHAFGEGCRMMDDAELLAAGLVKGSMGPVNLPAGIQVSADISLQDTSQWLVGANEEGYHFVGAQPGRDFDVRRWVDVCAAQEGDLSPEDGSELKLARGIECGQIFQLGTKYSECMGATFADKVGQEQPLIMGCYGIGVTRVLSAAIEQSHDAQGIIWPVSIAPFAVSVIPLTVGDKTVEPAAQDLAAQLAEAGLDVVLDDRKERPGVKFADNDLMGFPYQLIIGKRGMESGTAEIKVRATGERFTVALDEVVGHLLAAVQEQMQA